MRVLIIEDNPDIAANLGDYLEDHGHTVDFAGDGVTGLHLAVVNDFDCIVLDLALPGMDGLEVCRKLRSEAGKDTPVLMLTARDRLEDKLAGFETGADDYLVKPFRFEELQARLNAMLRRASGWSKPVIDCGPISLDTGKQTITVEEQPVELTAFEYRVLEYLMLHAGQVVSKAELTDNIYDQDYDRDSNVLEVFIGRLRRKLDPDNRIEPIETLRGRGYRFRRGAGTE